MFALDRLTKLAPQHPEWKETEPFKSVFAGDREAMAKFTDRNYHRDARGDECGRVSGRLKRVARHRQSSPLGPAIQRSCLQAHIGGYEISAREGLSYIHRHRWGGQAFLRVYSEQVYGVPPAQVIGSIAQTGFYDWSGKPVMMREPKAFFIDGPGKQSASICSSASGPTRPLEMPKATPQCRNGLKQAMALG